MPDDAATTPLENPRAGGIQPRWFPLRLKRRTIYLALALVLVATSAAIVLTTLRREAVAQQARLEERLQTLDRQIVTLRADVINLTAQTSELKDPTNLELLWTAGSVYLF